MVVRTEVIAVYSLNCLTRLLSTKITQNSSKSMTNIHSDGWPQQYITRKEVKRQQKTWIFLNGHDVSTFARDLHVRKQNVHDRLIECPVHKSKIKRLKIQEKTFRRCQKHDQTYVQHRVLRIKSNTAHPTQQSATNLEFKKHKNWNKSKSSDRESIFSNLKWLKVAYPGFPFLVFLMNWKTKNVKQDLA